MCSNFTNREKVIVGDMLRRAAMLFLLLVTLLYSATIVGGRRKGRERRDTVRDEYRKWPHGNVPFVLSLRATPQTKDAFRSAISEIELISCVKFVPWSGQSDYVRVITGDGCYSMIGRDGGMQELSLGNGCYRKGIALHETMHLLGFFHEQSRLDRDNHVTVHYYNAIDDAKKQFKKYRYQDGNTLGESYDPESIMHYENNAFSKNGRSTITYNRNPSKRLGQRDTLSDIDIRQLNKLYSCSPTNNTSPPTTAPRKFVVNILTNSKKGSSCKDDPWTAYTGQCRFNKLIGLCYRLQRKMSFLCRQTCGFCRQNCYDTSSFCPFFVRYGYCQTNTTARKHCRKTCRLCY